MIRSITLLAVLTGLAVTAQEPWAHVIEGRFDTFTTDELGNVYALRGDELELYDTAGKSGLRNSVKTFGRITAIDAFYSLKPMVFSPEQGQLALLDNTLSVQGSVIDLPRQGWPQVVLACMSVQNAFWLFDQRELALMRVDAQLRPLADTGRLDQLLGHAVEPVAMHEHESRLYVNDPAVGFLVFDLFGTYARTIPIRGASSFEVRGDRLYFFGEGRLQVYDMRSFAITDVPLPEGIPGDVRDARVERGRVYLRLDDRILLVDLPQDR